MNDVALAVSLPTTPANAFVELRERPRFWFPLLLMVFATAAVSYWYHSTVDVEWLKSVLVSNNGNMTPEQSAAALNMITRTTLVWSSLVGTFIIIPVIFLFHAVILLLTAKVTKAPLGFKYWFTLVCWTSLPALLGLLVGAILLALSDTTQISPGVLQALSLNELIFHRPEGSPGKGLLDTLSIPAFLSWTLMIIGVKTWSQRSWEFSAAFVLVPLAVIFGLWAFIALR